MASGVGSSVSECLQKSFEENVAALRKLIKEAVWDNDTLLNTTQQHLSKLSRDRVLYLAEHSQSSTRGSWMPSRLQWCAGARDFIPHQPNLTSGLSRNYFEHFGA